MSSPNTLIHASNDSSLFEKRFLNEHVWFHVRVAKEMVDQIKYVAVYQTEKSGGGQITHVGKVRNDSSGVVPYGNTGGYLFNFESIEEISPLKRTEETKSNFQSRYYTNYENVMTAKDLTELEKSWVK